MSLGSVVLVACDSNGGWNTAGTKTIDRVAVPAGASIWDQWLDLARRNIITADSGDDFVDITELMDFQLTGPDVRLGIADILALLLGIVSGVGHKLRFIKYSVPSGVVDFGSVNPLASFSPRDTDAANPCSYDKVDAYIGGAITKLRAISTEDIHLAGVFMLLGGATAATASGEDAARQYGSHVAHFLDRVAARFELEDDAQPPFVALNYHWVPDSVSGGPFGYRFEVTESLRALIKASPVGAMIEGESFERQYGEDVHYTGDSVVRVGQAMARALKGVPPRVLATS